MGTFLRTWRGRIAAAFVACSATGLVAAHVANPEDDQSLVGPWLAEKTRVATENPDASRLDERFLDETAFRPGGDWLTKIASWNDHGNVLRFTASVPALANAVTVIDNPRATPLPVVLSVSSDDGFRCLLNGELVAGADDITPVFLDAYRKPVVLPPGRSVLLFKLENWYGPFGGYLRLLPAETGLGPPLLEWISGDRCSALELAEANQFEIEWLDEAGAVVRVTRAAGGRKLEGRPVRGGETVHWTWYGERPVQPPKSLRVWLYRGSSRLLVGEWPWERAMEGPLLVTECAGAVEFKGLPEGSVFAQPTTPSREGYSFLRRQLPAVSLGGGRWRVSGLSAHYDRVEVCAPGFQSQVLSIWDAARLAHHVEFRGGVVHGRVVSESGESLAGVLVHLGGDFAVTDSSGAFSVNRSESVFRKPDDFVPPNVTPRRWVQVSVPGYEPVCELKGMPQDGEWLEPIQLRKGATLSGEILEARSGAGGLRGRVIVENAEGKHFEFLALADGTFSIPNGFRGLVRVTALAENIVAASTDVSLTSEQPVELAFRSTVGTTVSGTIVDASGSPLRGVTFHVLTSDGREEPSLRARWDRSDRQGRFLLDGLDEAADYTLTWDSWGESSSEKNRARVRAGEEVIVVETRGAAGP